MCLLDKREGSGSMALLGEDGQVDSEGKSEGESGEEEKRKKRKERTRGFESHG